MCSQKAAAFSLLGGVPRLSVSSKKSAGGTSAPLIPDFLHHETGEFLVLSHGFIFNEILRNCRIAGGLELVRERGTLLFAKAKRSKRFYAPRARFCELRFAYEILRFWIIDSANAESRIQSNFPAI